MNLFWKYTNFHKLWNGTGSKNSFIRAHACVCVQHLICSHWIYKRANIHIDSTCKFISDSFRSYRSVFFPLSDSCPLNTKQLSIAILSTEKRDVVVFYLKAGRFQYFSLEFVYFFFVSFIQLKKFFSSFHWDGECVHSNIFSNFSFHISSRWIWTYLNKVDKSQNSGRK